MDSAERFADSDENYSEEENTDTFVLCAFSYSPRLSHSSRPPMAAIISSAILW